ncbi:MAG: hypothetical protein EOP24_08005 [Hyphomicrobiales bacterium]|nr:MAG: hypothetical protein EOP24_08005 [Hyphomicrobiales bacterium]
MSIIVPNAYALTLQAQGNADRPIVGWHNLVTVETVAASFAAASFPATNLGNPATNLLWKSGSVADQYLTVLFGLAVEVDYIATARHNFGSGQVQVTVQGLPFGGNPATDSDWVELVAANLLANDWPALWRFAPDEYIGLRLKLEPGAVEPQAAVLYCGKLLVFEKGVQAGHAPLPYARRRTVISPLSQSGEHLGRVISGGSLQSSVSIIKLTPAWYRSTLDPFFEVAMERPFFWGWRPTTYPDEIGYAWLTSDPVPNPSDLAGYIDVQLQMEGLLL